jgi:RHS repeat-associated protein
LYDGNELIAEYAPSGAILRRYVHGPGDDEPVVWYEGAGLATKRWLHTDERGSVIAVTNAAGVSIATNRYDEYGIPQSSVALGASTAGRFMYTGQIWIPELGLYYYKARFYSPTLGRFMQTDPIGYEDGINWYAYVDGDPVNRVDPTGLFNVNCFDLPESCGKDSRDWKGFSAGKGKANKPSATKAAKTRERWLQGPDGVRRKVTDAQWVAECAIAQCGKPYSVNEKGQLLYRGGRFKVRPQDIEIGADGVVTQNRGVSVTTNPTKIGGAHTFRPLPEGLGFVQDGARDHYIIVPTRAMSPKDYEEKILSLN